MLHKNVLVSLHNFHFLLVLFSALQAGVYGSDYPVEGWCMLACNISILFVASTIWGAPSMCAWLACLCFLGFDCISFPTTLPLLLCWCCNCCTLLAGSAWPCHGPASYVLHSQCIACYTSKGGKLGVFAFPTFLTSFLPLYWVCPQA